MKSKWYFQHSDISINVSQCFTCENPTMKLAYPDSSQYINFTEEARLANGVRPDLVRVSVGIEAIDDILEDLDQALKGA